MERGIALLGLWCFWRVRVRVRLRRVRLLWQGGKGSWEWSGIGKRDSPLEHALPFLEGVLKLEFPPDAGNGMEEKLANEGENGGVASWNAVLGDGGKELAENEVDIGGGEKVATDGGSDFRAKSMRFQELLLGTGVEEAERRMIAAEHAATAAVGEGELAEPRFVLGREGAGVVANVAFSGHESLGELS